MSSTSASLPALARRRSSALERLGDEGVLVVVMALFASFVVMTATPYMLIGDSWLTFLGGREIAAHGLPSVDTLTMLAHGRRWVDQQWLAQWASYELESTFGLRATVAVFVAMVIVPFVFACQWARRRGASPRSVAVFALLAAPAALCAVRAQAFSYLLFAPFLALLATESRRPTRRVWLALPVLVLWANLHGAVLVAAALVALLGVAELRAGRRLRGAALLVLPWPCLLASPYGFSLVGYYRETMDNPLFKKYILEWAPPTFPTFIGLPFFATAAAALVLFARHPRRLTFFESGALALTLLGALTAQRSIAWFAYAALLFLPTVLERAWPHAGQSQGMRRLLGVCAAASIALGAVGAVASAAHASARIDSLWPQQAIRVIRAAVDAHPHARIAGAEESSDWLLYELPEVRGRVAFDGRFEILSQPQFQSVRDYLRASGPTWERASLGARYRVVDPYGNKELFRAYESRGYALLYRNPRVAVFDVRRSARG